MIGMLRWRQMTMPPSIRLDVSHPEIAPGKIEGFRFLWAFYVNGYDPALHCQPCFRGALVQDFSTPTARSGQPVVLDRMSRYRYVYICGVASGPKAERGQKNLHLPLEYAEGHVEEATTYNGYTFRAHNARALIIPPLPAGWGGKPDEHTRCKNFQFAVAYLDPVVSSGEGKGAQ
jgi:hypothetical protein